MVRVYLSSTYNDLKVYREVAYHNLRQIGYEVTAMEDYVACDERPLDKCLADVAACDLYIGIFAWTYGIYLQRGTLKKNLLQSWNIGKLHAKENRA